MKLENEYLPGEIEPKWERRWREAKLYRTPNEVPGKPNWYALTMYPYPSGDLHLGHWYAFVPSDAHARFMRMSGYNVLHPIGFDAFGLPAENAAIKHNIHPKKWTYANMENMRRQFQLLGGSYDADRDIATCDPEYYKWNQYFFLKFMENGLAYRAAARANWCPDCQTTLANEQVKEGLCERCETPVTKRDLKQWFLGITKYADELLDMSKIDWPKKIVLMQTNWIGRSEGATVRFPVADRADMAIEAFTTRHDTIFGVEYVAVAPEHPLVEQLTTAENRQAVEAYVEASRRQSEIERTKTDKDKTGVLTGSYCINPINDKLVPIFVSDYILGSYGTGAVMGVPAHDARDFIFAQKYDIPIPVVIAPPDWDGKPLKEAFLGKGVLVNSGQFDGLSVKDGQRAILEYLEAQGYGKGTITYRIRDWLISRQRYWGTPIPVIHCEKCGEVPVPYEELPVQLPDEVDFSAVGISPLESNAEFVNVPCPRCKAPARRETDTMDTFMDSSWYHLRYLTPHDPERPFDNELLRGWMPVHQYTGGAEHAVMHLLYARFFCKALRDLKLSEFDEPYQRLFNQGIMLNDNRKISKRSNPLTPEPLVKKYGADTLRCYLMFLGPWEQGGTWTDSGINGIKRWLSRVWDVCHTDAGTPSGDVEKEASAELRHLGHITTKRVLNDMKQFKYNTAISALMELTSALFRMRAEDGNGLKQNIDRTIWEDAVKRLLLHLAPLAPYMAEELWSRRGNETSIHLELLPEWSEEYAKSDSVTVAVQINGKLRGTLELGSDEAQDEEVVFDLLRASDVWERWVAGKEIKRRIYVKSKLLNLVVV